MDNLFPLPSPTFAHNILPKPFLPLFLRNGKHHCLPNTGPPSFPPSSPLTHTHTLTHTHKKTGKSAVAERPETRVVNAKLKGYFSEEEVVQLEVARREVPSSAPQYWQKVCV